MSKHKEYINEYYSGLVIENQEEKEEKVKKIDGYSSEVYDEIDGFEDKIRENADLYEVREGINLVLKKPEYEPIQSMTPKMDVNKSSLYIDGVTKDNCPQNEELLKQFVKDLQEATKSKLKFKAVIEENDLDGLKKFQLKLTVLRK